MPYSKDVYWTDLRSKRDITKKQLTESTCGNYNYYDPLLTPKVGVVDLSPKFNWLLPEQPKSWQLNLHSFRFADYWIINYQHTGDVTIISRLEDIVVDYVENVWCTKHRKKAEYVLSDVSVASRAAVIAFLIGRIEACVYNSTKIDLLYDTLAEHVSWCTADENYNSNNHGLFNDLHLLIGLINAPNAKVLVNAAEKITLRLLSTFLDRQINEEGVHLEHTPAYALLWVNLGEKIQAIFSELAEVTNIDNNVVARLTKAIAKVKKSLWWFVKPNGELINVGDQGRTFAQKWLDTIEGSFGGKLFRKSGYGFYKNETSYLAFVGAYHATKIGRSGYRAASHKQRDELHCLWSENDQDILIDTGLRGYDFGPERKYTFSKQAHNTLSLDPSDYLTGKILDYMDATEPYGSAICNVAASDQAPNIIVMAGLDPLLTTKKINHSRFLVFHPSQWLLVCDIVKLSKGSKAEWNYHIAEDWRCANFNNSDAVFRINKKTLKIKRFANTPVKSAASFLHRGDFEPLRGWRFAGDPFAISNLRFIEWLPRKTVHIRTTAFSIGKIKNSVQGVNIYREGDLIRFAIETGKKQNMIGVSTRLSPGMQNSLPEF